MTNAAAPLQVACQLGIVAPGLSRAVLDSVLPQLADAGYRSVVLPRIDPTAVDLEELAEAFHDTGVTPIGMAGLTSGADVGSSDQAERARGELLLRQAVDVVVALGGDQLNGVPYGLFGPASAPINAGAFERAARVVGAVADEAHDRGVVMTFEVLNRYETAMINTAMQAVRFIESSTSPHLRIHLDTYHMAIEEEGGIVAAIELALPWLGYVELGQSGRGPLARGAIDLPGIIAATLDAGYTGRWGIEAFSRSLLTPVVADRLAIWRSPYADGISLAREAQDVVRAGWEQSTVGRLQRAARFRSADQGPRPAVE